MTKSQWGYKTLDLAFVCCLSYLFELFHVDESILVPVKNLKISYKKLFFSAQLSYEVVMVLYKAFKKVFRNKSLLLEVINFKTLWKKMFEGNSEEILTLIYAKIVNNFAFMNILVSLGSMFASNIKWTGWLNIPLPMVTSSLNEISTAKECWWLVMRMYSQIDVVYLEGSQLMSTACSACDWERSGLLEENPQSGCSDICASLKGPL